ncbi:trna (guanine-n)-methyltransferase [Nannochloropsis oceanica]
MSDTQHNGGDAGASSSNDSGGNKKRPWVPPKFVQEALGHLPIVEDGQHPQKRFYRSRAHCNPLSHNDAFEYPPNPDAMDWCPLYPALANPTVRFLDVGCGFGGLTVALSTLFPEKVVLALEIRAKVCEFVRLRIQEMRKESPPRAENANVLKTNAMKYLPHFFHKGQLEKIFFCFPDPHFKAKNHRRRIISERLLTEYAYLLAEGGLLYAITDVEELHHWHVAKLTEHASFERIPDERLVGDVTVAAITNETEEGKKVERAKGKKFLCVFRRRPDAVVIQEMKQSWPEWTGENEEKEEEE